MAQNIQFAARVHRVKPSFTLEMTAKAAELRARGEDVINFSVGEPDFNTPENIRSAAKQAMDEGFTKYTPGSGMMDLREAICSKLKRENNLDYNPVEILVSNGVKQSLYLACQALFEKGDQVIVFAPYWVSFPEFVVLSDAEAIVISTNPEERFEPDFDELETKISDRVKGVIINSPSNPTGGVWSKAAVIRILELAAEHNWVLISDECYERLIYEGDFISTQALNDKNVEVITCMSLSKTYAMTGWRIGYAAGNKEIIRAMAKIQGQATSCANSIGQRAAIEALNGDQNTVEEMRLRFLKRRDLMVDLLNKLPNVTCTVPGGAFYAFPDFSAYISQQVNGKILDDSFALCDYFLESSQVVTVPGDGFGAPGHIRFSFAVSRDTIRKGMERVESALSSIT